MVTAFWFQVRTLLCFISHKYQVLVLESTHFYMLSPIQVAENLAQLMYSVMMTGYMFKNAQNRLELQQSLEQVALPDVTDRKVVLIFLFNAIPFSFNHYIYLVHCLCIAGPKPALRKVGVKNGIRP